MADLDTNLSIIEEFTQRLQTAVLGAEETTANHEYWVTGPEDGTIPTPQGQLKTLRGQIADWFAVANQTVSDAIIGYDNEFLQQLSTYDEEFSQYLLNIGFEPPVLYAAGLTVERISQTYVYNGVTYYWTGALPYVTTGSFGTETGWLIAPITGGIEIPAFTFATGGQLIRRTQTVLGVDGEWYYWTGNLPKTIPAASTVTTAGGVGQGLFKLAAGVFPVRPMLTILATATGNVLNSGSFEYGATVPTNNNLLAQLGTGRMYRWAGSLPKVVNINSTPENSGGISPSAWVLIDSAQGVDGSTIIQETPPTSPTRGMRWSRCSDMKSFIWYVDVDGGQWVEDNPSMGGIPIKHNDLLERDEAGAHDAIYRRASTVAEVASGVFEIGARLSLTDRADAPFNIEPIGTYVVNGFDILDAGVGKVAVLDNTYSNVLNAYGNTAEAFAHIESSLNNNSTILLNDETYVGSFILKNHELKGKGTSSKLKADSVNPVLTIKRKTSSLDWDFYKVSDMSFDGTGASSCVTFDPTDAFSGRTIFDNVQFLNGGSGVKKPRGNIGDGYYNCNFRGQDFGWDAQSSASPIMHTGATVFQQSNFDVIEKACIKSKDNVDGPGGLSVRDSLMQGCNGFGAFLNYNNFIPAVPPTFDNVWVELIAKNTTTEIDSISYTTREFRFENVPYAVLRGTYVKSMELVNSVAHLVDCRLDDASGVFSDRYVADDNSQMLVEHMYGNGEVGSVPYVKSIANQANTAATKNLSVRGPLKTNRVRLSAISNATNICSNSYAGSGPWAFTATTSVNATQVSDGVLGDTCAELVVPNGATLLSSEQGTPTNGKWVVWGVHAKKVSGGNFTRSRIGYNWTAGQIYLRDNQWVCSYGIKKVASSAQCRMELVNNSGVAITLRLADFFCVEFATFKEAIEFVNSGLAVRKD